MTDILTLIPLPELTRATLDGPFTLHALPAPGEGRDRMLADIGPRVRGIVTGTRGTVDAALLDRLPALRLVACFTAGQDMVDIPAVLSRGIALTNNSAALADSVADLAMGLLLAIARDIPGADAHVRAGRWPQGRYRPGALIGARRFGIVGLGNIGRGIALRLQGFGAEIGYFGRAEKPDAPWRFFGDITRMATWADVLMVAIAGGPGTDNLVSARVIEALGPKGWLVNVARASVVDQAALVSALAEGRLERAALDVFENEPHVPPELIALPNLVLSPHQGSSTDEALEVRTRHLLATLREHLGG